MDLFKLHIHTTDWAYRSSVIIRLKYGTIDNNDVEHKSHKHTRNRTWKKTRLMRFHI